MSLPNAAARHARSAALQLDRPETGATVPAQVAIVGLGYVGLPTALSLRDAGTHVIGIDISDERLDAIRAGHVDLLRHDRERLARFVAADDGLFTLTADPRLLADADAVIICVPTPVTPQLVPDLRALQGACASVVQHARPGQTIILTSTTYVGCTRDLLVSPLHDRGLVPGCDVHVVFSPERIDPGVEDHAPEGTPRVVGGLTPACTAHAAEVLSHTSLRIHRVSSPEAAELTKLLENTFRAVNISFANEMADIARHLGIEVKEVIDAAASKPYGFMAFRPGPGVGGHCIPCDPHYLLWQLRGERISAPVIDAAMTGIATRPRQVVRRVRETLADVGRPLDGARVHVLGVTYKPGVADVRESPALEILAELMGGGAEVSYGDELVPTLTVSGITLHSCPPERVDADIVLVHTRQPGSDLSWLDRHPHVLDATFSLDEVKHRTRL